MGLVFDLTSYLTYSKDMLQCGVNSTEQLTKAIQMILDATHYYRQLIKVIMFKNNNYIC